MSGWSTNWKTCKCCGESDMPVKDGEVRCLNLSCPSYKDFRDMMADSGVDRDTIFAMIEELYIDSN